MTDFHSLIAALRRPRLLIRAARIGSQDYLRDRDLARIIGTKPPGPPDWVLPRLVEEEERMEQHRRSGDLRYSGTRHIDVMVAMISELRLLPRDHPA
jgi:Family of unknown function (DUF6477)